ncbi:hypothetical protein M970_051480 [Encephalitozoon cuniculi EcunIII-L]|uniref:Uncharacterized protein n=1 Tax=Encephalitozoon cuniculi TaxID=6035 RepID=M1K8S0_ENCCN|nr:hypothetical protein ECU05_1470 [Encephalitozoon cuniculi]KMV66204.1 hypothetical protein M970_051480 [Encephalitozoon cuniculi EcunIII-L]
MGIEEKTHLLVTGNKEMSMLVGTAQAHIMSPDKGYTVKRISPSNTFIVKKGNKYIEIKYMLELVENPLDLEKISGFVPSSSVWNLLPAVDVKGHFHLGDRQMKLAEKELKLLRLDNGYAKINYKDTADVLCYMNSIKECPDFNLRMDIYPQVVKKWALDNFVGDSTEIGLYCLLTCDEGSDMPNFLKRWKESVLDEVSAESLIKHMDSIFLPSEKKARLLQYLSKLVG